MHTVSYEVKINGQYHPYRLGEKDNEGYFEVLVNGAWVRASDVTTQRTGFLIRKEFNGEYSYLRDGVQENQ